MTQTDRKDTQVEAILPLSPLQEGLLFHALDDRAEDPYFTQTSFLLEGALDVDAFTRAFEHVVARHAVLRTSFVWEKVKRPVQVVRTRVELPLVQRDFRDADEAERARRLAAYCAEDRRAGFALSKAPLMRSLLAQVGDQAFVFVNSHHHLLLDGWSFARVLHELLVSYRALARGNVPTLEPVHPFRDYLAWVGRQSEAAAEAYFRSALAGFSAPTPLPLAHDGSAPLAQPELPHAEQSLVLSKAETAQLVSAARTQRITLNTLVQGAFALLLQRHAGARDVLFGTTVAGRPAELPDADAIVGLLINTLPLRVAARDDDTVVSFLRALQQQNVALREHEWMPLSRATRLSELPSGTPLFESIVVFDSYPEPDAGLDDGVTIRALAPAHTEDGPALLTSGRNNYPLSLIVEPNDPLKFVLSYARARFPHAQATALLRQLRTLLLALSARPERRLGEIGLLAPEDRERVLHGFNNTSCALGESSCVHHLFEAQAERHPERPALVHEQTVLSYGALDAHANALAHRLQAAGAGAEVRVALCLERSAGLIVALLATHKAGAAYVPVDPSYPDARLEALLADSGARIVVTDTLQAARFAHAPERVVIVVDDALVERESTRVQSDVRPENLAYLIYTSGSTGRPKGVAVEHRQLVHYVRAVLQKLPLEGAESMAFVSTVAADLGHTSLFGALCSGRTLHVLDDARTRDPDALAEAMSRYQVGALKIVPSHLAALLTAADPARVLPRRCLVLGGESASPALLERVRSLAPRCAIVNHYGPTETTVGALTYELSHTLAPELSLPIGRPLPNMRAYVLDLSGAPVAPGAAGELYLGGDGVARGYHEAPGQTAARFVPDPFSGEVGARLYRTGDRVRLHEDGAITFLGRVDFQVKIRGYRVELGEIEVALRALSVVAEATVVLREHQGTAQLVGYVVLRTPGTIDGASLKAALAARLPEPMVPAVIMVLTELPLTANGKIDRAKLPEPGRERAASVAPRNPLEAELVAIWSEVLGRADIGIHESFFELGGDSILSLQIVARCRKAGLRVTPKQLFAQRTVAALAATLGEGRPAAVASPERARDDAAGAFALSQLSEGALASLKETHAQLEDVYPASPIQQGMLFHAELSPETNPYFNQIVARFTRGLDVQAFREAFADVSARHPILRTGFVLGRGSVPHQYVLRSAELPCSVRNLRGLDADGQAQVVHAYLAEDRARSFDFGRAPLMRVALFQLREAHYEVVWSLHHALLDGWCQTRLLHEWFEAYEARCAGRVPSRANARSYRSYIDYLARADSAEGKRFFRAQLAGKREPTLLPSAGTRAAGPIRELRTALSCELTDEVRAFAQRNDLTLNTLVQAAWAFTLGRHSSQDDVLFGVTVSGRPPELEGAESIMGVFINSLPLRVRLAPALTVSRFLAELQAHNVELRQHEQLPLVEVQALSDLPRGAPLFEALLVYQNYPLEQALAGHQEALGIALSAEEAWTHYPLTIYVLPGERLSFSYAYDAGRLEARQVARMAADVEAAIARFVRAPEAALGTLTLPDAYVDPRAREPRAASSLLLAQLASQIERTPDAVALEADGAQLSYRELDRRASQLAHALVRRGVGPGSLVGLCSSRSAWLLTSLLAVLRAGAAYVPLDPSYPRERLSDMVEDAELALLISERPLAPLLPKTGAAVLFLDEIERELEALPTRAPDVQIHPESLAYVIYTSGSTGKPKGVMVRHGGLASFLEAMRAPLHADELAVMLATTSLSFDIAVLELLLPLLVGGKVVLATRDEVADRERLCERLTRSRPTILQATPTAWKLLVAGEAPSLRGLVALSGGEPLTVELVERLRALGARTVNLYGPTEATVWSTVETAVSADQIGLGTPLSNTSLYVLDRALRRVPVGVAGEIYLGGEALARGYLRRPALTAERFLPDPFATGQGARLYRTGDLARYREDGSLEYLGRADEQVKIRGHRIELGEIEAALQREPSVREAVVVARDRAGSKALCAYVVAEPEQPCSADALRASLRARLPAHMIPDLFVPIAALPRTPNGKLDRRALPEPSAPVTTCELALEPPRTATEACVAEVYSEVLQRSHVAREASFFALGGHSLLATQAVSRLRERLGSALPLRTLFEQPSVAALAAWIDSQHERSEDADSRAIERVARAAGARLPLSFAQQRLWLVEQLESERTLHVIPFALRLAGPLDVERLRKSFELVLARHEVLRTAIVVEQGEAFQVVSEPAPFLLPLRAPDDETLSGELATFFAQRFALSAPPLLRAQLFQLAPELHVLSVALHHIAVDGWSFSILIDELMAAYRGELARPSAQTVQYLDYAVWQRRTLSEGAQRRALDYFRAQLADRGALALPGRRALQSGAPRAGRLKSELSRSLLSALEARAAAQGATLFIALYAALDLLLFQQTGRTDLTIGIDVAGRDHRALERMVGFFVNQLVLRSRIDPARTLDAHLTACRELALGAYAHQALPFERLVAELELDRATGRAPLFQVKLVLQNVPATELSLPGLTVEELAIEPADVEVDLLVNVAASDAGLQITYDYRADLYPAGYVEELAGLFAATLARLAEPSAHTVASWVDELSRTQRATREQAAEAERALRDEQRRGLAGARRKRVLIDPT